LAESLDAFSMHCAAGIEPNRTRIAAHLADNLMLVTALNPHIGYEESAKTAMLAHREGLTLKEAALKRGIATEAQFDAWIDPEAMTRPLAV
jgi:fumarate hydratase class II